MYSCINKKKKSCCDLSNGLKKIYYCLPQEPDFQVRWEAVDAHFIIALQSGLGGGSRWCHREEEMCSSGRKSYACI